MDDDDEECFVCASAEPELESKPLAQREIFYCDFCNIRISFGDDQCANCYTTFSEEYWRKVMDEFVEADDDDFDQTHLAIAETEDLNLCCNRFWRDCHCPKPIPATDIYEKAEPGWYEDNTECMNCVFIASPACPVLRKSYKNLVETGEVIEPITPCGSFKLATL